jgi:hypothetical protein
MPKKKTRKPARARSARRTAPLARKATASLENSGLRKGEILAGVSTDGKNACRLVVMEIDATHQLNHADSMAHAAKVGGELPNRIDALVLGRTMKDKFQTNQFYWTSEDFAGHSNAAWGQWFSNGYQSGWDKSSTGRVCVVRRLPL